MANKEQIKAYLAGHMFSYTANAIVDAVSKTPGSKKKPRAIKSGAKRPKLPSPIKGGIYQPSASIVEDFRRSRIRVKLLPVIVSEEGTWFSVGEKKFHLTAKKALPILNAFLKGYSSGDNNGYVQLPLTTDDKTGRQKTEKWRQRFSKQAWQKMLEAGCVYQPLKSCTGGPTKSGRMLFVDNPRKLK